VKFRRANGGTVSFSDDAAAQLAASRQIDTKSAEAGGMLLGRILLDCDDVIIDRITQPHARDRSTRFQFFRRRKAAQLKVNMAWSGSKGTCVYLGEWHTHPEANPTPSATVDRPDWFRIVSEAVFEQDFLLFAIVGLEKTNVWEIVEGADDLYQLEEISDQQA